MAFNGVPFFLDGGVEHDATVMRTIAYALFGGVEGIMNSTDFEARQGDVPGAFVNLQPGVAAVLNRQPGGFSQMYVGRSDDQTPVDISPTDSSGARHDMIVAIVKDPLDGSGLWSPPADRANGPYFEPMVISGVPANAETLDDLVGIDSYNAIPLWRVDIPVSTGTITNAMLKDLRVVSNPMTGLGGGAEKMWTGAKKCAANSTMSKTVTSWTTFPSEASWSVPVPKWATNCDINIRAVNLRLATSGALGTVRTNIGGSFGNPAGNWDFEFHPGSPTDKMRVTIEVGGTHDIPEAMRGTNQTFSLQMQGAANGGVQDTGVLTGDSGAFVYATINWKQRPAVS